MGQPTADQISAEYQSKLGRAPTASELASELDNANRYGWDTGPYGGLKAQIDKRATNVPGAGEPATAGQAIASSGGRMLASGAPAGQRDFYSTPMTPGAPVVSSGPVAPPAAAQPADVPWSMPMSTPASGAFVMLRFPDGTTRQLAPNDPSLLSYLTMPGVQRIG